MLKSFQFSHHHHHPDLKMEQNSPYSYKSHSPNSVDGCSRESSPTMGSKFFLQPKADMMFKVIVVGDSGVGKTAVLRRLIRNRFEKGHYSTVGVEFCSHVVKIDEETTLKLQIWDTAGQETFRSIVSSFYRNSSCVFIVYDITRRNTFEGLSKWIEDARQRAEPDAIFILLGNHADREQDREITYDEGEAFMRAHKINFFFETSAKNGQNIMEAFTEAGRLIFLAYISQMVKRGSLLSAKSTDVKAFSGATPKKLTLNPKPVKQGCLC